MGAAGNKTKKKDNNSNLRDITINEPLFDLLKKIPNDQYTCTDCRSVPEIIDINFTNDKIIINCVEHGKKELKINEYFKLEFKNLYYNDKCEYGQREQKDHLDNIFCYCPKCKVYMCQSCNRSHNHQFGVINVNELNNKCQSHLKDYFKYCKYCNNHFCKSDKKCGHPNEFIKTPKEEDLEKLKNLRNKYFYLYKLIDTIITTYEKHPSNYFNSLNIINISKKDEEKNNNEGLLKKVEMLEKKIMLILNDKLNIELTGEEKILILNDKDIGNKYFDLLCILQFKKLQEISLRNNNISNINSLININSPALKKLDLSYNKIMKLDVFKDLAKKCEELEYINLSNNEIENANVFKEKIFRKIKEINLQNNRLIKSEFEEIKNIIIDSIGCYNKFKLIYKLDRINNKMKIFGEKFIENNKNNFKIKINNEEKDLCEYYKPNDDNNNNEEYLIIELIKINDINNLSFMFHECSLLFSLPDIANLDISNVKDISYLFYGCSSLRNISDISKWDTSNVKDMRNLFSNCSSILSLPDISKWKISNVDNINSMFFKCLNLSFLSDISNWNTSNVTDMSYLFYKCISLESLPDISKWNVSNVKFISYFFYECVSLKDLPDISKWNTSNFTNIIYMFNGLNLKSLKDISNWDTSKVTTMKGLFSNCTHLKTLPDISKWKTSNVKDMSEMFLKCSSLTSLPDISQWDTSKVTSKINMFYLCNKEIIPNNFK